MGVSCSDAVTSYFCRCNEVSVTCGEVEAADSVHTRSCRNDLGINERMM